jgi:hypothetical protein
MARQAVQDCQFGVLRWPWLTVPAAIAGLPGRGLLMVRCPARMGVPGLGCTRRAVAVMVRAWGGLHLPPWQVACTASGRADQLHRPGRAGRQAAGLNPSAQCRAANRR